MQTREQEYAIKVYDQVSKAVKSPEYRDQYGSMAHQLPVLVRSAGLAQALAFVAARGKQAHKDLLNDLAQVLGYENGTTLAEASRRADLMTYMLLTERVLAALVWYKRFAQSVLDVAHGE